MKRDTAAERLLETYTMLWNVKFRPGKYSPSWGRDLSKCKSILKRCGSEDDADSRLRCYFEDEDEYLVARGYPIGLLIMRLNQYSKEVSSVARARVEAKKKRDALNEDPGKLREAKVSDPKSITELLKEWKR